MRTLHPRTDLRLTSTSVLRERGSCGWDSPWYSRATRPVSSTARRWGGADRTWSASHGRAPLPPPSWAGCTTATSGSPNSVRACPWICSASAPRARRRWPSRSTGNSAPKGWSAWKAISPWSSGTPGRRGCSACATPWGAIRFTGRSAAIPLPSARGWCRFWASGGSEPSAGSTSQTSS